MCSQAGTGQAPRFDEDRPREQMDPRVGETVRSSHTVGSLHGPATQAGVQASPGNMLVQKAYMMRRQADALMMLGNQMLQMEKQKQHETHQSRELSEALMTLFR